jgi:NADH dehydrogenase I D subunit
MEKIGEVKMVQTQEIMVNMGPHHPATHGVLRLVLRVDGETVTDAIPYIGYLHRGIEKLAESKTYSQFLPITDRLDYVSAIFNNFAYCLAVEKLLEIEVPERAQYIRVILAELNRIASHLVWLGTQALDIGAWTPMLYCFRDREKILDLFELYCGQRMTFSCFRIGGVAKDLPEGFIEKTKEFLKELPKRLKNSEDLLTKNEIWLKRTVGIGKIPKDVAINYGITGPILRASGVKWDLRKNQPYSVYDKFYFDIPTGENGDAYDRYIVRVEEIKQSRLIIEQALDGLPSGRYIADDPKIVFPDKEKVSQSIEALIHQFYLALKGFSPPQKEAYVPIESPRGELGFYIVSDGSNKPYRLKIRSPIFSNIQILSELLRGAMIADVVAIVASLDPILGEIDR